MKESDVQEQIASAILPIIPMCVRNYWRNVWMKGIFQLSNYAAKNGRVTNSDVQRILNTNRTTAYRLLQQMGTWLEMQGVTGKSTYYTIKGLPNASQTFQK